MVRYLLTCFYPGAKLGIGWGREKVVPGIGTFLQGNDPRLITSDQSLHPSFLDENGWFAGTAFVSGAADPISSGTLIGNTRPNWPGQIRSSMSKGTGSMKRHAKIRLQRHHTDQWNAGHMKSGSVPVPFARAAADMRVEDGYDWLSRIAKYRADSTVRLTGS